MNAVDTLFVVCAAIVFYAYMGYPLVIWLLTGSSRPQALVPAAFERPSFSFILVVFNEAARIERRLRELDAQINSAGLDGEIIVVSDGSTDDTVHLARAIATPRTRILDLPAHIGKAAALNQGAAAARHEILLFGDIRQSWSADAIGRLLGNFADPAVGAVGGAVVLESASGALAGVGLYWRYESWLRRMESRLHATVGVSGPIAAARRNLFQPIPTGTILDDVYWPLCIAMHGFRVVYDENAIAFDRLPQRSSGEFRRKVRTLSGNFQLCMRLPAALLPSQNPIWFQFVSHKLLRLVVPWAMLAMLAISVSASGTVYRAALAAQAAFYLLGLARIRIGPRAIRSISSAAGALLLLNAAGFVAFWVWLFGRAEHSWTKVSFDPVEEPVNAAA